MDKAKQGRVIVIAGPSGVGKGTVIGALKALRDFRVSVSHTTRGIRPSEADGVSYHFVTREQFRALVDEGLMLETTCYQGNYYGTSRTAVEDALALGQDVVLDIEVEGARNVRRAFPDAIEFFLLPPSMEALERRLRGRNSGEDEQTIQGRLAQARVEIACAPEFDYIVVNDVAQQAAADISGCLCALACRAEERAPLAERVLAGETITL
ncbi:MAG: guanylate kinase [Clostridiales bacterium]|nr:guanylate kinase [Clostridiales bacterium]MCD8335192.1 guanylate kinase [Clostridiales bacterium]